MEKIFSISKAKTHFSSLIKQVKAGTNARITERGKPVAIISRIEEDEVSFNDWANSLLENNTLQKANKDASSLVDYHPKKNISGGLKRFIDDRD